MHKINCIHVSQTLMVLAGNLYIMSRRETGKPVLTILTLNIASRGCMLHEAVRYFKIPHNSGGHKTAIGLILLAACHSERLISSCIINYSSVSFEHF